MFQGLPGNFLSGLMVSLGVVGGGNAVGVRSEIMKLCGSLVRIIWHVVVSRGII
jgi:hypothetical protein